MDVHADGRAKARRSTCRRPTSGVDRVQGGRLGRRQHVLHDVPKNSGAVNTILGTQHMCDAMGRCATVPIGDGQTYMNHSGNVRNGPASGGPPANTGVWSPMFIK